MKSAGPSWAAARTRTRDGLFLRRPHRKLDNDGDGYYGEYSQDQGQAASISPRGLYRRIPVYSGAYSTLDNILQKTINYETKPEP